MAHAKDFYCGFRFPEKWSVLDKELFLFRKGLPEEHHGKSKSDHFWKVVSYLWGPGNPVKNRTKIFIRNPWSEAIIEELCEQRYLAVGGAAGTAKSETLAVWLLVNYLADPRNVLCVVISTSLKAARKRIWGSLVDLVRAVPAPGLPLKVVDSQGIIRYNSPTFIASDKSSIALVAAERSQEKEAVGRLIGMHNQKVLVVGDELTELPESILEYALPGGNLTSNPEYQFVGLANPNGYYDSFAKFWKPAAGWLSISVDSERWETAHGIALHFDALRSPNVLAGRVIYPFLPTQEKIDDAKKAEGGANSIRFWRMMRGFMSPVGSEDLIYSEADIVKAKADEPAQWNDEPVIHVAGLDPSFTNGGDRSIAFRGTLGTTVEGIRTLCFDFYEELVVDVTKPQDTHSYQIAELFKAFCERHDVSPFHAAADATGAGGPFCDILQREWSREVLRVYFGGLASDLPVSLSDPTPGKERYYDRVTEIWYRMKEMLRQGQIKGIIPAQAQEMAIRRYGTTGAAKKIYAESKKDMKFRTGGRSCDIADGGFILLALCCERLGFNTMLLSEETKRSPRSWSKLRARKNAFAHAQRSNLGS